MTTGASVGSALLKRFRPKGDNYFLRLVTIDETWAHYYESGNKAQCHQWEGPGSHVPRSLRANPRLAVNVIYYIPIEIVHYITWMCVWDTAVDPDRTPPFATSDLGLLCLQRPVFDIMAFFNRCAPIIVSI